MRVNISYSVELEDVPAEVERLLSCCDEKMKTIHEDLAALLGEIDPLALIDKLDKIRLRMAATDFQLDDCMQLLSGYIQTLANKPAMEHGRQPEISEEIKDE